MNVISVTLDAGPYFQDEGDNDCPGSCTAVVFHQLLHCELSSLLLITSPMHADRCHCSYAFHFFLRSQAIKSVTVVPANLYDVADYVHRDTVVKDTVMEFSAPTDYKLMDVNLGTVEANSAIVATIGVDNDYSVPSVLISDDTQTNLFYIVGSEHYDRLPPCRPYDTSSTDGKRVSTGSEEPVTYKVTFVVSERFGLCETAQDGGYINAGVFNKQLDITKPIYFMLGSTGTGVKYAIKYISLVVL